MHGWDSQEAGGNGPVKGNITYVKLKWSRDFDSNMVYAAAIITFLQVLVSWNVYLLNFLPCKAMKGYSSSDKSPQNPRRCHSELHRDSSAQKPWQQILRLYLGIIVMPTWR